jgi:hypothetical protein
MGVAFYGAAIASARLGKDEDVVKNLKSAVTATPSLKGDALEDLEFAKYLSNEAFRAGLK